MNIALVVLFPILIVCYSIYVIKEADSSRPRRKKEYQNSSATTRRTVVFRDVYMDVKPAKFKVTCFNEGNLNIRLLMHGPTGGVIRRHAHFIKNGKVRSIVMDRLYGIVDDQYDTVHAQSVEEAKTIANAIYGKKKKKQHLEQASVAVEKVVQKTEAVVAVAPPVVAAPMQVQQKSEPVSSSYQKPSLSIESEKEGVPVIRGFKSQVVGTLVSAKPERHFSTRNGQSSEYESFTVTINTASGVERLVGNDLARAVAAAKVQAGDEVRVIYVKDIELPNGFKKKQYQVINLSHQAQVQFNSHHELVTH
ncbi:MAG: hypothetical protein WCH01_04105 [Methylococcaceae bacterium]